VVSVTCTTIEQGWMQHAVAAGVVYHPYHQLHGTIIITTQTGYIQFSDYNFTSALYEKSAPSLPLLNTTCLCRSISVCSCGIKLNHSDDPYWTSRENNLELIELFSTNKVRLVSVPSCSKIKPIGNRPYMYWSPREKSL
jgi:hypothetical protein